jgi:hypothetical protein
MTRDHLRSAFPRPTKYFAEFALTVCSCHRWDDGVLFLLETGDFFDTLDAISPSLTSLTRRSLANLPRPAKYS